MTVTLEELVEKRCIWRLRAEDRGRAAAPTTVVVRQTEWERRPRRDSLSRPGGRSYNGGGTTNGVGATAPSRFFVAEGCGLENEIDVSLQPIVVM